MKKHLVNLVSAIVAIFCGLFAFSACSKVEFKVNFVVDGAVYATLNTNGEEIIKMPENPAKEDYDFDGWYWDKDTWQTPFTANSLLDAPLSSDMNVYCKWKPKTVRVSGISLNKSEVSLHVNETEILTAAITPENATDTSVLWESSNASIATVTGGKITALRVGTATITATANDGGQIASCIVTVSSIPVESVSLNYTQLSMLYNENKTLVASVMPQNATETGVIWKSSNSSVVAVENGKLTATGYGSAVITVTTVDGGKTATCTVEVVDDKIEFKTLSVEDKRAYGKVSNATETFSLSDEIIVYGNAEYQVYEEIGCKTLIVSKTISLNIGDNTVYVLQTVGKTATLYTVTVRRRPIHTVSFDTDGGTNVQPQQVEEDSFATAPTTQRAGYTFTRWNYDFSQAIANNTEIKAIWTANTDTPYQVKYYLQNLENDEYTLHETNDLQGTTDVLATAEQKTYEHFTFNPAASTMQGYVAGDGSLVLKAYYTRNRYSLSNSNEQFGSITNAGSRKYGESVSTKATPQNLAHEFLGWFSGETLLSEKSEYTFTAEQDVTAKFRLKEGMSQFVFNATADTCEITGVIDRTLQRIVIPDCVTAIRKWAFSGCSSLQSVAVGTGLSSVAIDAFEGCSSLQNIYITDIAAWCKVDAYGILMCDGAINNDKYLFLNGEQVKDLVISGDVKSIGKSTFHKFVFDSVTIQDGETVVNWEAFYDCSITQATIPANQISWIRGARKNLQKVTLTGEGVIEEEFAFSGCSALESVVISQGLTVIGRGVFQGCTKLTSVTMPDSLENIGSSAFADCSSLAGITIPDSVTAIGNYAFSGCENLASITLPDKVLFIGEYAFNQCSSLTSITIPNEVTTILKYAFYQCSQLTSITLQNNIVSLKDYAFSRTGITTITLPNSVKSIGPHTFSQCEKLTSIEIPNSVTSIGNGIFYACSNLASITIPNSVTIIGDYAFKNCSSLTNIKIPDSVMSIGYEAFYNCTSLKRITIPSNLKSILDNTFYNCTNLISIEIPNSVANISDAFKNCASLKIYYKGTKEEWVKIQGYSYSSVANTPKYWYSETTRSGNFWHYNENGEIEEW